MNLYAKFDEEGKVELSGAVFCWNHVDGDTRTITVIKSFPDINACLDWLKNAGAADYIASKL